MVDESRLERIENKLDQMGEAIVALARMEERMISLFKKTETLGEEQAKHGRRIQLLENRVGTNGQALRFAERLFWIVAAAGVSYLFMLGKG